MDKGWCVVREPGWAYSWGLWQSYQHPEVAIFGLPPQRWGMVNVVAELVSAGERLRPGQEIDDVLVGGRVAVRRIDPTWSRRLFRRRSWPVLPDFLQIVWPDRDGGFPWEAGHTGPAQRRLWLPVDAHTGAGPFAGSWCG